MALTQWQLKPVATDTIASGDFVAFTDEGESGDPINKLTVDNLMETGLPLVTEDTIAVASDYILFLDGGATGNTNKEQFADVMTAIAGTGLSASSGVLNVDAAQTGITSVGTIGTGTWQGTAIASAYIADDAVSLAKMASGTDGQIITYDASGNPTAVGPGNDGQVLTSTGAGSPPAFEDAGGGGIERVEQWRLHTSLSSDAQDGILVENWELDDTTGYGRISAGMSLSSGVFTFPQTGVWQIEVSATFGGTGGAGAVNLKKTEDANAGSPTYTTVAASGYTAILTNIAGGNAHLIHLTNIDSVTTDKIKFEIGTFYSAGQMNGSSTSNNSTVVFTRLGDAS